MTMTACPGCGATKRIASEALLQYADGRKAYVGDDEGSVRLCVNCFLEFRINPVEAIKQHKPPPGYIKDPKHAQRWMVDPEWLPE